MKRVLKHIDLNCDLGEGYADAEIFPYISSCNIACGGHTGDEKSILIAIESALENNVRIGAHPSYPDKENFGRLSLDIDINELLRSLHEQLMLMLECCKKLNTKFTHLKPHGALYNDMARDKILSEKILSSIKASFPNLIIYGLSRSAVIQVANKLGFHVVNEVFADRAYNLDGTLVSRLQSGAVHENSRQVELQLNEIFSGQVICKSGDKIPLTAESICLHSDTPQAAALAKKIHDKIKTEGIELRAYS